MRFWVFLLFFCAGTLSPVCALDARSQAVLEEINLARQFPRVYAEVVAASGHHDEKAAREATKFLTRIAPLPPLRLSSAMSAGAALHALEQGVDGTMGHRGRDGSRPWDRLERFGTWGGAVGENINYGDLTAREIVVNLIVDSGVPDRGHRKNIFSQKFGVAGVAMSAHRRFGSLCVIDFAGTFAPLGSTSSGHKPIVWHGIDR